jgi:hypothetical protein
MNRQHFTLFVGALAVLHLAFSTRARDANVPPSPAPVGSAPPPQLALYMGATERED